MRRFDFDLVTFYFEYIWENKETPIKKERKTDGSMDFLKKTRGLFLSVFSENKLVILVF